MLIPMYFLIGRFGGPRRQYAAVKFFLYRLFGGLIMLAALIGLYVVSRSQPASGTFDWAACAASTRDPASPPRAGCSSASSSPSRSRRRWCRCTPGCPTPVPRRRSARGAAGRRAGQGRHVRLPALLPAAVPATPRATSRRWCWCCRWSASSTARCWRWGRRDMKRLRRLHLDRPLRLHRAGHLRLHDAGVAGAVLYMVNHGLSTGAAVPRGRPARRAAAGRA